MSTKEKQTRYREAVRYLDDAKEILRTKAEKKDRYYQDEKYVKMACGTAYSGVLKAVDTYLEIKGKPIEKKKGSRISVDSYRKLLTKLDKGVLNDFNTACELLHLAGYYEGLLHADAINSGLDAFSAILNKIRPMGEPPLSLN